MKTIYIVCSQDPTNMCGIFGAPVFEHSEHDSRTEAEMILRKLKIHPGEQSWIETKQVPDNHKNNC